MKPIFKVLIIQIIFSTFIFSCNNNNSNVANQEDQAEETVTVKEETNDNLFVIETELGNITFEVYPDKVPITVNNFLRYVDQGNFEGATFYRVVRMDNQPVNPVKIEVIQGNFIASNLSFDPIEHETTNNTGVLHKDGTISMARLDPGTASAAFFICINDQPELDFGGKRNPDGQGFAAFGQVTEGMDIVRQIQSGETDKQTLKNPIVINSIKKIGN